MPDYCVIAIDPKQPAVSGEEVLGEPQRFTDLGIHTAHDAEAAIGEALEKNGGIPKGVKRCVATPASNWSEREVEEEPRPRFKIRPVSQPDKPEPVE